MPSVSGIQISSSTRSGRCRSRCRRASPALSATETWCPSSARISDSSSRMPTSSSTTSMWAIALSRLRQWQQHAHRGAAAWAVLDGDAAVMLVDDLLHDGEPEAGATRLGCHVRLEDARHQFLGETAAIVRYREADFIGEQLGAYLDCRADAGESRILQCILRILYQVVDDLPDLRRIGPYRRQVRRKPPGNRRMRGLIERKHLV